jgi:hypothetical protein
VREAVLAQELADLEVEAGALLQPAVQLHHDVTAEHQRRVALFRAEQAALPVVHLAEQAGAAGRGRAVQLAVHRP